MVAAQHATVPAVYFGSQFCISGTFILALEHEADSYHLAASVLRLYFKCVECCCVLRRQITGSPQSVSQCAAMLYVHVVAAA